MFAKRFLQKKLHQVSPHPLSRSTLSDLGGSLGSTRSSSPGLADGVWFLALPVAVLVIPFVSLLLQGGGGEKGGGGAAGDVAQLDAQIALHYGVPYAASVMAFDPVQRLLAVGTL